jgi:DNA modification methylase
MSNTASLKYAINDECFKLIWGDSFCVIKKLEKQSVDMIFADPPYFLSSGGISCHSGKQCSVDKGKWDIPLTPSEKLAYNRKWLRLCREVLKDNGTIWISGTYHNIYSIGVALELEGYSIINNITWQKPIQPLILHVVASRIRQKQSSGHASNSALRRKENTVSIMPR